ncbi:MAG TPA: BON domain-containing protein [Blastocatellia bacterium]|nr:BON domain-containing protein [Blastocatellia bacterium]
MKCNSFSNFVIAGLMAAATSGLAAAAIQDPNTTPQDSGQVTADQQKQNKADRDLTRQIRKAVVSDKTLSVAAHNVKIVSRDGMVTLRGQVKSEDEKKAVEDKATEVAGAGKVTNELTVAPSGSK